MPWPRHTECACYYWEQLMSTVNELFELAVKSHQKGDLAHATSLYRQILVARPSHVDALNNLGDIHLRQYQIAEAAQCFESALRIDPRHANARYNLGTIHYRESRFNEATQCFREAARCNPCRPDMHINLGNSLKAQGLLDEAITCYRQALGLSPNHPDAHNNLGLALIAQGQFAEANACFHETLRLDPDHRMAHWNLSCLRLLQGDLAGAWAAHEHRWARPGVAPRLFAQPRWDGSPLAGKTILVHAEQGLGDTIQFARYLQMVEERGGKVLFECQAALIRLFHNLRGVDGLVPAGELLPPFDVHIPLLSLPGVFGTSVTTIPADIPYLNADPELVLKWDRVLAQYDLGRAPRRQPADTLPLTIGLCWQGNPAFPGDATRSISLKYYEKIAQVPGIRLVSLQKERMGADQLPAWSGRVPILDLSDRLETLCDTAAVMKNLDLVISSCTSVAHLAGALGVPVWTVLQFVPDWRWFLERSDSPWYPTMRLFRQKKPGDWDEVFERVATALRSVAEPEA